MDIRFGQIGACVRWVRWSWLRLLWWWLRYGKNVVQVTFCQNGSWLIEVWPEEEWLRDPRIRRMCRKQFGELALDN